MGNPKRLERQYDVPRMKWNKSKIRADKKIMSEYGLKTKKEIWKAETEVRKFRKRARLLLAGRIDDYATRKDELLKRLEGIGILSKDSKIEDVLKLEATDFLDRRLQTLVFRNGLALTANQARQLITHNHILVNGKVRTIPGSLIKAGELIAYSNTKIKNEIDRSLEEKGKPVSKEKKSAKEKENKETAEPKKE